jgi:hypothetical protein
MLRLPIPFTDAALLLSPRLGHLHPALQWPVLLAVMAVPVALVIWLYRSELRLVRPSSAAAFLGLRLLALLTLLFVIGLQPILSRTVTEVVPGRVLVAVDRSDSMATADPQRTPLEKLKLARGLRLGGDTATSAQIDEWIKRADASGNFSGLTAADSTAIVALGQQIDKLSRAGVAYRVLSPDGVGLVGAIGRRHALDLVGFSQEAGELPADQLERWSAPPAAGGSAAFTDLRLPLVRALERSGSDGTKILGVVLLTDGQHNWGPPPVAKAAELGERGVPVYPVPLGPRTPPPDASVVSLQAPPAVFKNADANVEARVQVNGLPAGELKVTLTRPGAPPTDETLSHPGGDRVYTVRFRPRMEEVGTQVLTVSVAPVEGEIRPDNNRRAVTVNVADDKARVLLADGEARWEYHYLASALERDRTMQLNPVLFRQPRVEKVSEEDLLKSGNPATRLPAEPDGLAPYDCVILGDVSSDLLPPAERERLEKYVADRGGTLVILAGKRSMPLAFLNGPDPAAEPLARLLPVEGPRPLSPPNGFPVTLTAEGRLSPFLQLEATPEKSDGRWAALPRHFWGVVGRAKPGAVPLAFVPPGTPAQDAAARHREERDHALVVRQNYGFGRVLFVGIDSTWRWRFKTGDLYHHRFWGQVIRWAASDKPLVAGNDVVRFGTREPVYAQGQEIDLVARFGDAAPKLPAGALAAARLVRLTDAGEENAGLVPLARNDRQPRELDGKARDLTPGQYAIELVIPDLGDALLATPGGDGRPQKLRATFTVAPPDSAEAVELATNWPLCEELAAKSGGQVFAPEDAAGLVKLLTEKQATRSYPVETWLWQSWWTLWVFLLFVTLEWLGRKWAGLP